MEILKVNGSNFENEVLKCEKTVLIDFFADWCGPCKMVAPILNQIAEENSDIKVVKVNVDDAQDLAFEYGVMSIPTIILFENGVEKKKFTGFMSKDDFIEFLK